MKLRILQSIENENYNFLFSVDADSISSDDADRLAKFGYPDINFGGTFDNQSGVSYTLPDTYYKLPTDFPVKQTFSLVAPFDTNSMTKLALYRSTIEARINDAVVALRALSDTFTGEYVINIAV
jgi:hypothetical protein